MSSIKFQYEFCGDPTQQKPNFHVKSIVTWNTSDFSKENHRIPTLGSFQILIPEHRYSDTLDPSKSSQYNCQTNSMISNKATVKLRTINQELELRQVIHQISIRKLLQFLMKFSRSFLITDSNRFSRIPTINLHNC